MPPRCDASAFRCPAGVAVVSRSDRVRLRHQSSDAPRNVTTTMAVNTVRTSFIVSSSPTESSRRARPLLREARVEPRAEGAVVLVGLVDAVHVMVRLEERRLPANG